MGQFYIDESIHDEAGFIVAACIYTNSDINSKIDEIIKSHNFNPEDFEHKSRTNYTKEPKKALVRENLKELIQRNCKLGIVVISKEFRKSLGSECIKALKQFIDQNNIMAPISVYFDQGIVQSTNEANQLIDSLGFKDCLFYFEQESNLIKGIQLADLAAHIASIQLKQSLGLTRKKVKAGSNSGYDEDLEIELGFEMWATLRYSFFTERAKPYTDNPIEDSTFRVEPFGLYLSELCDNRLTDVVKQTFSKIYLGCIH